MSYSVYLPNYSIGENCYKELPYVARNYGKKAVVIGGKTAMEKAKDALLEGIKGSDLEITDFIWYGGDSSYENGNALIANPTAAAFLPKSPSRSLSATQISSLVSVEEEPATPQNM